MDCFLLDSLYVTGYIAALHGWLGPPQEGTHSAEGAAYSDAYCLTPGAARWLLRRKQEWPGSSAEAYLMQLCEARSRSWTHLPRLALQHWGRGKSLSGVNASMRAWYEKHYFTRFPRALYAFPADDEDEGDDDERPDLNDCI